MTPAIPAVLVTGAAGYVGGHVVAELAGSASVRAAVRGPAPWLTGTVPVDLVSDDLVAACDGAGAVIHLAGVDEVRFAQDPDGAYEATVTATRRVVDAAVVAGVGRFVYLSTVHVYGAAMAASALVSEETTPAPTSRYAEARLASEEIVRHAPVDAVVLRLTNAVGPPVAPEVRRWTLVANDLCRQAVVTGRLCLRTTGMQWRDFIGMADVRKAIAAALTTPAGIYNVASGRPRTVRDVAAMVQDAAEQRTGARPVLDAPDADGAEPGPCTVDNRLLVATGWLPRQPVRDAIVETIDACLEWKDQLARD